jgi:hypothetical protein
VQCILFQGILEFDIGELIFGYFWKRSGFYHLQSNYARCYYDKKNCVLKVPKCENFLLAFFALSEHICVGDLGTKQKSI